MQPRKRKRKNNLTTAQREARKAAKRAEEAGESAVGRAPVKVVKKDDRLPWEGRKASPPTSPIPSSSSVPIPWSPSPPRDPVPAPAQPTAPTTLVVSSEYCLVVGRESSNKAGTKIANGRTVKPTPVERKEEQRRPGLVMGRRLKSNTPARFRHIKAVFEKKRAHASARWGARRGDKFVRAIREVLDAVPFGQTVTVLKDRQRPKSQAYDGGAQSGAAPVRPCDGQSLKEQRDVDDPILQDPT